MQRAAQDYQLELQEPKLWGKHVPGWGEWPEIEQMMATELRRLAAAERVLARHAPCTDEHEPVLHCVQHHRGPNGECEDLVDLMASLGIDQAVEMCRCGVPLASHQCTHCHDDPPRGHV